MLTSIRDRIKSSRVLGIALVLLIGAGFASFGLSSYSFGGGGDAVATVNGEDISAAEVRREYDQRRQSIRQMYGQIPEALDGLPLLRQSVQAVATTRLLDQTANDMGLNISDADLARAIQTNPSFMVDDQFDRERYVTMLQSNGYPSPDVYEAQLRTNLIREQLNQVVSSGSFATQSEVDRIDALLKQRRQVTWRKKLAADIEVDAPDAQQIEAYYDSNLGQFVDPLAVKLDYLELKLEDFVAQTNVSPEAVEAHFEKTKSQYQSAERRDISHILLELDDAEDADEIAAKTETLAELKARVDDGERFADLATANSQDVASKDNGGSIGEFEKGFLPKAFDEVAFALALQTSSDVVQTDQGLHLIYIDKILAAAGQSFDEVREAVTQDLKLETAKLAFSEKLDEVLDLVDENEKSIENVAQDADLSLQRSDFIAQDSGEGIGSEEAVREAAFRPEVLDDGFISEAVELKAAEHAVIVQVAERREASQLPLEAVEDKVISALNEQNQRDALVQSRDDVIAALDAGTQDFEALSELGWGEPTEAAIARDEREQPMAVVKASFESPLPGTGVDATYASGGSEVEAYIVAISGLAEPASETPASEQDFATPNEMAILLSVLNKRAKVNINDEALLKVIQ